MGASSNVDYLTKESLFAVVGASSNVSVTIASIGKIYSSQALCSRNTAAGGAEVGCVAQVDAAPAGEVGDVTSHELAAERAGHLLDALAGSDPVGPGARC